MHIFDVKLSSSMKVVHVAQIILEVSWQGKVGYPENGLKMKI